jgi:hypothetical protein
MAQKKSPTKSTTQRRSSKSQSKTASVSTTFARAVKKQTKRFVKRNTGLVAALIICLIVGIAGGFAGLKILTKSDGFTLRVNGEEYKSKITLSSGETYDLTNETETAKVVSLGKDLSAFVKFSVKYLPFTEGAHVTDYTESTLDGDGTYYVFYTLDYTGDDLFGKLAARKYSSVVLQKVVEIGEDE